MKLGIMQPYFLPYIGYFQLIAAVDKFIIYDNIKYTKKGWVNRNRMLRNNSDAVFSLPLVKGSDSLDIVNREISPEFDRQKLLNQFKGAYSGSPNFSNTYPLLESIILHEETNLFKYIYNSIIEICNHLNIRTEILISSNVEVDHKLKSQAKVIALCREMDAGVYINPIGGVDLYNKKDFSRHGIKLQFLRSEPLEYEQFGAPFVPWLSIVDVLMFNPNDTVIDFIYSKYGLN